MGAENLSAPPYVGIALDTHTSEDVLGYFEGYQNKRLFNPLDDPSATNRLLARLGGWQLEPRTSVVFTSGVFDLCHPNHRSYLLHTKLAAIPHHYDTHYAQHSGRNWDDLSPDERRNVSATALVRGEIRQVVSIDGDAAVMARKGNKTDKASTPRPIYSWQTRARDVLDATCELGDDVLHRMVDAVTIHDNAEPELADTPHAGIMEIGKLVQPDVWSIYAESTDIADAIAHDRNNGNRLSRTHAVLLDCHGFRSDEFVGKFSTTAIVGRLLGKTAIAGQ